MTILFNHAPWVALAACRGKTALYFSVEMSKIREAKALCETCPVAGECEQLAADPGVWDQGFPPFGVWAGKSTNANKKAIRQQRSWDTPINCGTMGGYQTHRYRGQNPCELCSTAWVNYKLDRAAEQIERERRQREFRNNGGHAIDWEQAG